MDYRGYNAHIIAAKCNSRAMFDLLCSNQEVDDDLFGCSTSIGDTLLYFIWKHGFLLNSAIIAKLRNCSDHIEIIQATINCAKLYNDQSAIIYFSNLSKMPELS